VIEFRVSFTAFLGPQIYSVTGFFFFFFFSYLATAAFFSPYIVLF
jgi:hypothetical protein